MRHHTKWLKATIEEIPALEAATFVTEAKRDDGAEIEPPYAVMQPTDGTDEATRLAGPSATQNPRWVIHGVGTTPDQAAWVGEQLKKKLIVGGLGIVPDIPGENPGRMWLSSPMPIQIDRDVSPPVFFHVTECGFHTDPA